MIGRQQAAIVFVRQYHIAGHVHRLIRRNACAVAAVFSCSPPKRPSERACNACKQTSYLPTLHLLSTPYACPKQTRSFSACKLSRAVKTPVKAF